MQQNKFKVQKIGNSLMLTIEKNIAKNAQLKVGDEVIQEYAEGQIIIKKVVQQKGDIMNLVGTFRIKKQLSNESVIKAIKKEKYDRESLS